MTMHRELGLPPRSSAPRVARRLVHELGGQAGLPDRVTSDAALVLGELVNTRLRQTHYRVDVVIDLDPDQVTVRVKDHSAAPLQLGHDPRTGPAHSTAVVERLASSWGYCSRENGHEVWALLRAARPQLRTTARPTPP